MRLLRPIAVICLEKGARLSSPPRGARSARVEHGSRPDSDGWSRSLSFAQAPRSRTRSSSRATRSRVLRSQAAALRICSGRRAQQPLRPLRPAPLSLGTGTFDAPDFDSQPPPPRLASPRSRRSEPPGTPCSPQRAEQRAPPPPAVGLWSPPGPPCSPRSAKLCRGSGAGRWRRTRDRFTSWCAAPAPPAQHILLPAARPAGMARAHAIAPSSSAGIRVRFPHARWWGLFTSSGICSRSSGRRPTD